MSPWLVVAIFALTIPTSLLIALYDRSERAQRQTNDKDQNR